MEPRIQYAKTSDGVSIAYHSEGEGPAVVYLSAAAVSHVQRGLDMFPNIFPPMTTNFRLIRFDPRGTGLSDRGEIDFSMQAMTRDFDAVVERIGLQSFAIEAFTTSVPIAVTYAATFPDRVSHLILIDGWTSWPDVVNMPTWKAMEALIDQDWTVQTETIARVLLGMDEPQVIEGGGEYIRACIDPEAYRALIVAQKNYDIADLLADVTAQTLVLQNNDSRFAPIRAGQKLAAGIPDARFLTMDDMNYERLPPLVESFMGTAGEVEPVEHKQIELPQGTTAILFADIANSTALTEQIGDVAFRDKARALEEALRQAIANAGGTAVEGKTLGDGVLAVFGAAHEAIACSGDCHMAARETGVEIHVGIHAGDVIREAGNVFGGAVNIAARVSDASGAGETFVSQTVRDLARTSAGVAFEDRGEHELKGIPEPQRLFAVREAE